MRLARPAILGLLVLTLMPACRRSRPGAAPPEPLQHAEGRVLIPEGSPLRQRILVQPAEAATVEARFEVPATVEADPADLVKVLPPLPGRIVALHVRLGDRVKPGQALATLESAEYAQAVSEATRARSQARLAGSALARVRELSAHEIASRKDLEAAEAEAAGADSERRRAEARLRALGAPTGGGAHLTLRAPIAARVSELAAAPGGYWNDVNAPLMVLSNLRKVWLCAAVQEKDIPKVYVGQEVRATLPSRPGERLEGRVAFASDVLDPETRTAKVRIPFANPDQRLLPAMFANVSFRERPRRGVLVPTAALLQDPEGAKVLVEVGPWSFQARPVRPGAQVGGATEILEGLAAGERVVAREGVLLHVH